MSQVKIQCVVAVIVRHGLVLMGKRSPWKVASPGFWCPISGRIEAGETEQQAIVREVAEEVGLRVKPLKKIAEIYTRDETAVLNWWLVETLAGEAYLANNEHTELRWVPFDQLKQLEPAYPEDIDVLMSVRGSLPGP